ncbi:hypothetical protein ACLMJK_002547 [Lecanora helva]
MSPPQTLQETFHAYLTAWNAHDQPQYSQYYAPNFHIHLPAFPPTTNKEDSLALFRNLTFFSETIHPTWLLFGERSVAMEAVMRCEALVDLDVPFPFTGKTYRRGEVFEYASIVHYEFNEDSQITTFRSFCEIQQPDPGSGIVKDVLPGYE